MSRPSAALLVTGLLVGLALSACDGDGSAEVGDVLPGRPSVAVEGAQGFVLIPTGQLDLTLGEPTTDPVSGHQARDGEGHLPPDGGSWIPVHVQHDPFGEGGVPIGLIGGAPQPAEVALVVDGTTVDLGDPYRVVGETGTADSGLGTVWVAAEEPPDEIESLRFAVTYDGLTQTLDPATGEREAGAAAAFYDDPAPASEASCPFNGLDRRGVRADIACQVGPPQRTPYLPGAGWADDGRTWLVVGAAISVDSVDVDGTSYDVETIDPRCTLDGTAPLPPDGFSRIEHQPSRVTVTWVFDASATEPAELTLALDLLLTKGDVDDPGPGTRNVTLAQVVDLG